MQARNHKQLNVQVLRFNEMMEDDYEEICDYFEDSKVTYKYVTMGREEDIFDPCPSVAMPSRCMMP